MSRLNIPSNSQQIIGKKKGANMDSFKLFKLVLNPYYAFWGKGKEMEFEDKGDA